MRAVRLADSKKYHYFSLTRLCQLRQQKAKVLGYSDHATFVLEVRMAKSPTAVQPFLRELSAKLEPLRDAELEVMLEYKAEEMAAAGGENTTTTCASVSTGPVDPLVSAWRVERRGEFSPLGPLASCFLALGFGLGLDGTVSARR